MKFLSLAAIVAVAYAATPDLSILPACSVVCFAQGAAAAGCGVNDIVCQCTTGKDALTAAVTPCVTKNCNANDQALTASGAIQICSQALAGGSTSSNSTSASTSAGAKSTTTAAAAASTGGAGTVGTNAAVMGAGLGLMAAIFL